MSDSASQPPPQRKLAMGYSADILDRLVVARLVAAPDQAALFAEYLAPIVAKLVKEALDREMVQRMDTLIDFVDRQLASAIYERLRQPPDADQGGVP